MVHPMETRFSCGFWRGIFSLDTPRGGVYYMGQFFDSLRLLGLLPQVGLTMVMAVLLPTAGGFYLDRLVGQGSFFTVLGVVLGVLAGFAGCYRLLIRGMHAGSRVEKPDRQRSDGASRCDADSGPDDSAHS